MIESKFYKPTDDDLEEQLQWNQYNRYRVMLDAFGEAERIIKLKSSGKMPSTDQLNLFSKICYFIYHSNNESGLVDDDLKYELSVEEGLIYEFVHENQYNMTEDEIMAWWNQWVFMNWDAIDL